MTDRELLEMAANAAGINLEWDGHPDQWQPMYYEGKTYHSFDPLESDGDALRLAVKLCMCVEVTESNVYACANGNFSEPAKPDQYAAARRAITRAAAAMASNGETV